MSLNEVGTSTFVQGIFFYPKTSHMNSMFQINLNRASGLPVLRLIQHAATHLLKPGGLLSICYVNIIARAKTALSWFNISHMSFGVSISDPTFFTLGITKLFNNLNSINNGQTVIYKPFRTLKFLQIHSFNSNPSDRVLFSTQIFHCILKFPELHINFLNYSKELGIRVSRS